MKKTSLQKRGFSLIELLVVIAILLILLAILAPFIRNAVARAKMIRCAANLRNIGMALQLYCNDNRGIMPGQGSSATESWAADPRPTSLSADTAWFNCLPPYVGEVELYEHWKNKRMPRPGDQSIFICPAAKKEPKLEGDPRTYYCSYPQNLWIEAANRGRNGKDPNVRLGEFLRISDIENATAFAVWADGPTGVWNGREGWRFAHTHAKYMAESSVDSFRHAGRANICFADGHVESFYKEDIHHEDMATGKGKYMNYGGVQWNPSNPNLHGW